VRPVVVLSAVPAGWYRRSSSIPKCRSALEASRLIGHSVRLPLPDQPTQRVSAFGDSGSRVALMLRRRASEGSVLPPSSTEVEHNAKEIEAREQILCLDLATTCTVPSFRSLLAGVACRVLCSATYRYDSARGGAYRSAAGSRSGAGCQHAGSVVSVGCSGSRLVVRCRVRAGTARRFGVGGG
jgi:hypothetical protein